VVEGELRGCFGALHQRRHRRWHAGTRCLQVDGDDGLVGQGSRTGGPARVCAFGQARRLGSGAGQHDGIVRLAIHLPATAGRPDLLDAHAHVPRGAALPQPQRGRFGQQCTQGAARQQQVGRAAPTEQGVAQHAQQHLRAGVVGRGVQRRHAQRVDQQRAHGRRQRGAQAVHREVGGAAEPGQGPAGGSAHQCQLVGRAETLAAGHADTECQPRRAGRQSQSAAVGIAQLQGSPVQRGRQVGAHGAHQRQRAGIGADENVLPVVQRQAVHVDGTRAAAGQRGHLIHGDLVPGLGGAHRRGQPGPAGAHHGQPHRRRFKGRTSAPAQVGARGDPQLAQRRQRRALVQHLEALGLDFAQQRAVDVGHHEPGLLRHAVGLRQ